MTAEKSITNCPPPLLDTYFGLGQRCPHRLVLLPQLGQLVQLNLAVSLPLLTDLREPTAHSLKGYCQQSEEVRRKASGKLWPLLNPNIQWQYSQWDPPPISTFQPASKHGATQPCPPPHIPRRSASRPPLGHTPASDSSALRRRQSGPACPSSSSHRQGPSGRHPREHRRPRPPLH